MSKIETIGDHTLYLGDCREILPTLGKVDAVVADPPYGMGNYETDTDVTAQISGLFDLSDKVALWGYPETLVQWCVSMNRTPSEWVTWWPTNADLKARLSSGGLKREVECIAIWSPHTLRKEALSVERKMRNDAAFSDYKNKPTRLLGDVWRDASPGLGFNHRLRSHPNEKPAALTERLCGALGGDVVLDPFMGSGTTGVACARLGRKFIGIEIEPKYFDIACKRIEAAHKEPRLFGHAESKPKPIALF